MFDINAGDGSVRKKAYESPIPGGNGPEPAAVKPDKLDGENMVLLHHRMLDHYTRELDKQHDNRVQMAIEEDCYDNIQWTAEDAKALEDRGQKPLVYNVVSASIDWVTGTEKRARTDYKILPRRKTESQPAERKSQLFKYLSDVNRSPFHVSRAFTDSTKVGVGWIEDAITEEGEDEPLYTRYENWRNILWDSNATEMDLSDARFLFRSKWIDLDIACALFKKRDGLLKQAAAAADDFLALDAYGDEVMDSQELELEGNQQTTSDRVTGYQRERVRIIEGWIRLPVETQRLRGGPFTGEIYDPQSRGHRESVESGEAEVTSKVSMRMHVAIFTTAGMLWFSESPYRHNQFPFTPIWGKRRGRDGLPYGMIRGLKDIQEDINKRASKALHILSTNKVIMDEGAVDDIDEFAEEVARPDAIIVKKQGKSLTIEADRELSQYQLELMSRSIAMIQQASGVTDELLGRSTNAKSGIAIQRRQEQGSMSTALYFDNLRLAMQLRGEKLLANIEQFMDERKAFRITNMRGSPEYVEVNDGEPENDIVRSKADFIISDADWHATLRQAAVTELLEVMSRFPPQVSLVLLDLVVENMDISNRDEIVKRIRGLTGQRDPDMDPNDLSDDERAKMAAQQEAQQFQRMLAMAELREKLAKAAKSEAEADKIIAQLIGGNVEAQATALEAAREALSLPPAAVHAADHILAEAGFRSASDKAAQAEAQAAQPAMPPGPAPTPAQP